MDTPRDIANTRLAKGEITTDEHTSILKRIDSASGAPYPEAPPSLPPALPPGFRQASTQANRRVWLWIAGGVAAFVAVIVLIALASIEGLSIGNLTASGNVIKFKLANSSKKSGDILIWVIQNGNEQCERVMEVDRSTTYNLTMYCPTLRPGQFTLNHQWAEYDRDMAAVAERVTKTH